MLYQSLYLNLDGISVARVAADAVRKTKIKFSGDNYMFLSVYLLLVLGKEQMIAIGLKD